MRIEAKNFGCYEDLCEEFPDSGLIIFSGRNGAGKSMIAEVLSWCLWRDHIRSPRRDWAPTDASTSVTLSLRDNAYKRSMSGFKINGDGTTSDNNEFVRKRLGSFKAFLSTSVFHRSLLVKFSNATDYERKNIIESMLDMSVFDTAFKSVGLELKVAKKELSVLSSEVSKIESKVAYFRGSLSSMKYPERPKYSDEDLAAVSAARSLLGHEEPSIPSSSELDAERKLLSKLELVEHEKHIDLVNAKNTLLRAKDAIDGKVCPTCGTVLKGQSKIDTKPLDELFSVAERVFISAKDAVVKQRAFVALIDSKHKSEIDLYYKDLRIRDKAKSFVNEHDNTNSVYNAELERYLSEVSVIEKNLGKALRSLHLKRFGVACLRERISRLKDLHRVFGPRGARVTLLLDVFKILGLVATDILARIYHKKVSLHLLPSNNFDQFHLRVSLPGISNLSYRALSEGERSVVDFALLKALSVIAPSYGDRSFLPIIYDDILDCIDSKNKVNLASYIENEANDRLVFLFSHDFNVTDYFDDFHHYRVVDGRIFDEKASH